MEQAAASATTQPSSQCVLAGLPESTRNEQQISKWMELEVKLQKINEGSSKTRALVLIKQEYDADLLDRQFAGINDFVATLTARKEAL